MDCVIYSVLTKHMDCVNHNIVESQRSGINGIPRPVSGRHWSQTWGCSSSAVQSWKQTSAPPPSPTLLQQGITTLSKMHHYLNLSMCCLTGTPLPYNSLSWKQTSAPPPSPTLLQQGMAKPRSCIITSTRASAV
jgi:hypothetical protein